LEEAFREKYDIIPFIKSHSHRGADDAYVIACTFQMMIACAQGKIKEKTSSISDSDINDDTYLIELLKERKKATLGNLVVLQKHFKTWIMGCIRSYISKMSVVPPPGSIICSLQLPEIYVNGFGAGVPVITSMISKDLGFPISHVAGKISREMCGCPHGCHNCSWQITFYIPHETVVYAQRFTQ
jgi:hypothetical protein